MLEVLVCVPDDMVGTLLSKGIESVISQCEIRLLTEKKEDTPQPKKSKNNPITIEAARKNEDRKLIKYKCPECGKINYKVVSRNVRGSFDLPCISCEGMYSWRDDDLVRIEYECDDCGQRNYFYAPEDETLRPEYNVCFDCKGKKELT